MPTSTRNSMKTTATIVTVVAMTIGGGIGYLAGHNSKHKTETNQNAVTAGPPSTTTKAAGLRVLLNNLEVEHVDLEAAATRAGFDGAAAFQATAGALDKNSHALSDAMGSVYGKDAGDKFYRIWNSHIGYLVDYAVAV